MLVVVRNLVVILSILSGLVVASESTNDRQLSSQSNFDVLEYEFNLSLSDSSDVIHGHAQIKLEIKSDLVEDINLDLISLNQDGKGMVVESMGSGAQTLSFTHANDSISIPCESMCVISDTLQIDIVYSGIPVDGLIISRNKFDDRTFFGDNWPNRARNWLPSKDHPGDKAKVQFNVTAPNHYQVISNGKMLEENDIDDERRLTKWRSDVELPTKVMVIGVARFSVQHLDLIGDTPLSSWVYPQDQEPGFEDFYLAGNILRFMEETIGEFPYDKLANVQSKTRYGGMENAGAIFYSERAVNSPRSIENLLAHEIAHQWFGDSVTEKDWPHIWLSEGFATYLTAYYVLKEKGQEDYDKMIAQMVRSVIRYNDNKPDKAIIDQTVQDPNAHLNTNSYQKGGLVLHMLRNRIGDDAFIRSLRSYYTTYRDSNADSDDFQAIAEKESQSDLNLFFDQWLKQSEIPSVSWDWTFDNSRLSLNLDQTSNRDFSLSIPASIYIDGQEIRQELDLSDRSQIFTFELASMPDSVSLSPLGNSLIKQSRKLSR